MPTKPIAQHMISDEELEQKENLLFLLCSLK